MKISPRERILTLLGGGQPDQVPWFGELDYWVTALCARRGGPGTAGRTGIVGSPGTGAGGRIR